MGRKRPFSTTEKENSSSPFPNCNVEYEIIDQRHERPRRTTVVSYFQTQNEHRHSSLGENGRLFDRSKENGNGNNIYGLRSGNKKARVESQPQELLRESPTIRRSRRIGNRTSEELLQLVSVSGSKAKSTNDAIGKRNENNEKHSKDGAVEGGEEAQHKSQSKEHEGEEGAGQSSDCQEEEEEGNEDEQQDTDNEEDQSELCHARYSFRHNRENFSKRTERRRPMRSCRMDTRSVAFVSDVCKKYNNNNFGTAAVHRLPSNPVLDRRQRDEKRHRRRRLDRCSSSSSGSSSDSSSASINGAAHSMRKDLKAEAKFEQRKLKSLLKGRQELMPINLSERDIQTNLAQMARDKIRQTNSKSSCADIDPMQIELGTGFKQVGGLTQHIHSLKEIVLFPLLYPHLFDHFKIQPPRGILFYGPPGTGKTLLARALAQECGRTGAGQIAFFMRKGADCLSKWVGESERQLRLLFDQAFRMRPSIIFFDEIDGLAPVRSSRQDQIHSSIVSTLLALMDGLDSRGEVIVIGATNRLDSIDPALRRPGRFDRELPFELPDSNARRAILQIHTEQWAGSRPDTEMLNWLAEQTSGYCGADLKALCTEAVLVAMRDCFPHMYISSEKLELSPTRIRIRKTHFADALSSTKPSASRASSFHSQLPGHCCRTAFIEPIVDELLSKRIPRGYLKRQNLDNLYETELERVVMALKTRPIVPHARLLLHGHGRLGQSTHFLPVLVNRVDHLPLFCLSVETVFAGPASPEENISQIVGRALRTVGQQGSAQALVLLPDLDLFETVLPTGTWKMLISSLGAFSASVSVLLLASVHTSYTNCSDDIKHLFCSQSAFAEIGRPNRKAIENYFNALFEDARKKPMQIDLSDYPTPPKAKIESTTRKFTAAECAELENDYQQMLRQFRIFLRDLLRQVIRDPRFKYFHLPVDKTDAEDYYEIIKNPMCLSQMMVNIDLGLYSSKDAFMKDIQLIRDNAIEYNPDTDMDSKQIRHAANALLDMAEALFSMEMDDDFPTKLEEARKLVAEAKRWTEMDKREGAEKEGGDHSEEQAKSVPQSNGEAAQSEEAMTEVDDRGHNGTVPSTGQSPAFVLDVERLWEVVHKATDKARICSWGVPQIECLGAQLCQIIDQFRGEWDRSELTKKMEKCVNEFEI